MFRLTRARPPLTSVFEDLPTGYHALSVGQEHLVVGPTGAFAVTSGTEDVDVAARRVADAAIRLRDLLCARLSWAPFVHTLVVVDDPGMVRSRVATVVPPRMLKGVLTEGHRQIAGEDVDRIVAAMVELRGSAVA